MKILTTTLLALLILVTEAAAQDTAPTTLSGKTGVVIISGGSGAFASIGGYRIAFSATSATYTVSPLSNTVAASAGTYTYSKSGPNTGRVSINDTSTGSSVAQSLVFTSPTTASYSVSSAFGNQTGTFVLENVTVVGGGGTGGGMVNMSVRAVVPNGSQVIPGLVLESATRVLVRVGGPALAAFGVSGTLPNPKLSVFSGANVIASNDDWSSNQAAVLDAGAKAGAFPFAAGSRDAAIVLDLNAGNYTFVISGDTGTSGEVLLEVYRVPN